MAGNTKTLAERLKHDSHRICSLILNSDMEWIDIAIEINQMREMCEMEAPEKLELFEAIYVSRFNRLWEQWRLEGDDPRGLKDFSERGFYDEDERDGWGLASA